MNVFPNFVFIRLIKEVTILLLETSILTVEEKKINYGMINDREVSP